MRHIWRNESVPSAQQCLAGGSLSAIHNLLRLQAKVRLAVGFVQGCHQVTQLKVIGEFEV